MARGSRDAKVAAVLQNRKGERTRTREAGYAFSCWYGNNENDDVGQCVKEGTCLSVSIYEEDKSPRNLQEIR